MTETNIKELQQYLEKNLISLNELKDELEGRLKLQQDQPWNSKDNAWKVNRTKKLIENQKNDVAEILDSISAKNKKNMNLAFKHGKTIKGKPFGKGVPGAPGAGHLRNYIAQFLGGKRRKTRRKTRRWKTKKRRKRRTRRKTRRKTRRWKTKKRRKRRRKKKRGYGGKSPKRRWSRKYKLSIAKNPKDFLKNNIECRHIH